VWAGDKVLEKGALLQGAIMEPSQDQDTNEKEALRVDSYPCKGDFLGMDLRILIGLPISPSIWRYSKNWPKKKS
jgi:hypothetical protein